RREGEVMPPFVIRKRRQFPTELPHFLFRLSVAQYHRMIDDGILTEDDPVELIEGCLVTKMPKKPLHSVVTHALRETLKSLVPPGWFVGSQEPVTTDSSEPEPDVAVVRGRVHDYREQHPGPADLALVAEVADTTLRSARGFKKRAYARA